MRIKQHTDNPLSQVQLIRHNHNSGDTGDTRDQNRNSQSGTDVISSGTWTTSLQPDPAGKVIQRLLSNANDNQFNNDVSSPDSSIADDEDPGSGAQSSSSVDASPQEEEADVCFSPVEDDSDSDSLSDGPDHNLNCRKLRPKQPRVCSRGIVNPNYPGFQHLADQLQKVQVYGSIVDQPQENDDYDEEIEEEEEEFLEDLEDVQSEAKLDDHIIAANNNNNINNNNNNEENSEELTENDGNEDNTGDDSGHVSLTSNDNLSEVNQLDSVANDGVCENKFYEKIKFNIPEVEEHTVLQDSPLAKSNGEPQPKRYNTEDGNANNGNGDLVDDNDCLYEKMEDDYALTINTTVKDVVHKMAETKLKMTDAFLSGAKEDLDASVAAKEELLMENVHGVHFDDIKENKYTYNEKDDDTTEGGETECFNKKLSKTLQCRDNSCSKLFGNEIKKKKKSKNGIAEDANESTEVEEKFNVEQKEKEIVQNTTQTNMASIAEPEASALDEVVPRKKEKMEINYSVKSRDPLKTDLPANMQHNKPPANIPGLTETGSKNNRPTHFGSASIRRREYSPSHHRHRDLNNRRSVPGAHREKRHHQTSPEFLGGFDVYNIETAMPKIDLEAIESHLRAAREEERRRRNDREEIRRKLAMGTDSDDYYGGDRPGRKPSLQSRLQSGMNLQICFMNETVSDNESPGSDHEAESPALAALKPKSTTKEQILGPSIPAGKSPTEAAVPISAVAAPLKTAASFGTDTPTIGFPSLPPLSGCDNEMDFFARQARLQQEARLALAQAKDMARMQMEVERQRQKKSPITEMVRSSLEKVGIPFPADRRRVSRQILTEMNVAQLQVIVNDLHTQIEVLNEDLVKMLMERDDLHMEQDSMLVDIEDLTRYLGAKEQSVKDQTQNNNLLPPMTKTKVNRIRSLVKK